MTAGRTKIWVDFENAPHVLVLAPVIRHLREAGFDEILFTARDFSYTVELSGQYGFDVRVIGLAGSAANGASRAGRVMWRASALTRAMLPSRTRVLMALSHGSRSQLLAARWLGIPAITLDDYEASFQGFNRLAYRLLCPSVIPRDAWRGASTRVTHYEGLKEEIYLHGWRPSGALPAVLKNDPTRVAVLVRPEAPLAHYHSKVSKVLQDLVFERLSASRGLFVVLLPRSEEQRVELVAFCEQHGMECFVPDVALDGPELMTVVDLVVGGGGTMTREAAVLGVPSYSFFSGPWGAVDSFLASTGGLMRIVQPADVERIRLVKRNSPLSTVGDRALRSVATLVEGYARGFARR
jgi:predicted glycosyltransferase